MFYPTLIMFGIALGLVVLSRYLGADSRSISSDKLKEIRRIEIEYGHDRGRQNRKKGVLMKMKPSSIVGRGSFPHKPLVTIVFGPPGSGKTTYVNEHRAEGDIVWDSDAIMQVVDDLSSKLSLTAKSEPETPSLWLAASEFISYRSQLDEKWRDVNLPLCNLGNMAWSSAKVHYDNGAVQETRGPITYENCKMVLDSPDTGKELGKNLSITSVIFKHCVIVYNGGQIILTTGMVGNITPPQTVSLRFENCAFLFSSPSVPAPQGQQLIREVLIATGDVITTVFKSGNPA